MLADSSPFFFFYFWTFDIGISRNHARERSKLEPRRNKSIRERKFRKFRKSIFQRTMCENICLFCKNCISLAQMKINF